MNEPTAGISHMKLSSKDEASKRLLLAEGNTAFDDDEFERALDCFHRASLVDGSDPEVWNLLGLTYTNLDFNQEAWRSFKLALQIAPDNLNSLWYSGEFLFGIEDMALTGLVLSRYVELEKDESKRNEALEMLKEAQLELKESDDSGSPTQFSAENYDLADEAEDADEFDGFEIDSDDDDDGDADGFGDSGGLDDEEFDGIEDSEILDDDQFVAHLSLQLERADSKCNTCQTAIPVDAPYCYSCKAPNFYESR